MMNGKGTGKPTTTTTARTGVCSAPGKAGCRAENGCEKYTRAQQCAEARVRPRACSLTVLARLRASRPCRA
eukprot:11225386-Lingulodinium_polyedra.AAC.1